jgi:hypothetical protein
VGVDRKANPARAPMRLISRLMASGVNGPPRSVANTKVESGNCRRSSRRYLVAAERLRARLAVLGAAHVQRGGTGERDLAPLEVGDPVGAQAVTIRNEDQRRITMAMSAAADAWGAGAVAGSAPRSAPAVLEPAAERAAAVDVIWVEQREEYRLCFVNWSLKLFTLFG